MTRTGHDDPPTFTSEDAGVTSAADWREWLATRELPPAVRGWPARMLVVSAHPDDEVLGAGGLISDAVSAGVHVTVVCLSDGAASHPGSPTVSPGRLATIRRDELGTALSVLGVNCVIHRDLPDGVLDECTDAIEAAIADAVAGCGGHDLIVTVWRGDRHPDHAAAGRAAVAVAQRAAIPVLEYPVWMWQWAARADPDLPWSAARTHRLSSAADRSKRAAVQAFTSQISDLSDHPADRAVLAPHVLDRLTGPTEMFFG